MEGRSPIDGTCDEASENLISTNISDKRENPDEDSKSEKNDDNPATVRYKLRHKKTIPSYHEEEDQESDNFICMCYRRCFSIF